MYKGMTKLIYASAVLLLATNHAYGANETEAYKLAVIDANQFVKHGGMEDKRAQAAITAARTVCDVKSEGVISSQAVLVTNLLAKDEIFARPVDILEGLNAVLNGGKSKANCSRVMANYAGLRKESGFTHSQAIASMRVLENTSRQMTKDTSKP